MRCTIQGCPGEYEERLIVHTVRHNGQVIVIDHVPAEVCRICGDVLLKPANRALDRGAITRLAPTHTNGPAVRICSGLSAVCATNQPGLKGG